MTISVIDFYREEKKEGNNSSPDGTTLGILAEVNGKRRDLVMRVPDEFLFRDIPTPATKNFEKEKYSSYVFIVDFLRGDYGLRVKQCWGLSDEDFKELPFELYLCLMRVYATCGIFKKFILMISSLCKFYLGRELK